MRIPELDSQGVRNLLSSSDLVLLHFGTDWCAPCKRLERVLGSLRESGSLPFELGKVNVEDHPELAEEHGVSKSPTLCLFKTGCLVAHHQGYLEGDAVLSIVGRYAD